MDSEVLLGVRKAQIGFEGDICTKQTKRHRPLFRQFPSKLFYNRLELTPRLRLSATRSPSLTQPAVAPKTARGPLTPRHLIRPKGLIRQGTCVCVPTV